MSQPLDIDVDLDEVEAELALDAEAWIAEMLS